MSYGRPPQGSIKKTLWTLFSTYVNIWLFSQQHNKWEERFVWKRFILFRPKESFITYSENYKVCFSASLLLKLAKVVKLPSRLNYFGKFVSPSQTFQGHNLSPQKEMYSQISYSANWTKTEKNEVIKTKKKHGCKI